jgi:hypothetical protein
MSGTTRSDAESAPAAERTAGASTGPVESPELCLAVVAYSDGPDRCTVHPPGLSGVERMSTWISLDRDDLVDVAAYR